MCLWRRKGRIMKRQVVGCVSFLLCHHKSPQAETTETFLSWLWRLKTLCKASTGLDFCWTLLAPDPLASTASSSVSLSKTSVFGYGPTWTIQGDDDHISRSLNCTHKALFPNKVTQVPRIEMRACLLGTRSGHGLNLLEATIQPTTWAHEINAKINI